MGRMFRLLYLLLERGQMTAAQLAEELEVSIRTVYRDIDQLSAAGIPVFATQGKGGGIEIDQSFVLDRSLLSGSEQQELLSAVQSFDQIGGGKLAQKLSALFREQPQDWISVDFSSWGTSNTFELLKTAILAHNELEFTYYNTDGEKSQRVAWPLKLWFKSSSWYLYAYCTTKQDYRIFRCSRMTALKLTGKTFVMETHSPEFAQWEVKAPMVTVVLQVQPEALYRILDEFPAETAILQPDGSQIVTGEFIHNQWLYGYLLSFGSNAKVLAPESLREAIWLEAKKTAQQYL